MTGRRHGIVVGGGGAALLLGACSDGAPSTLDPAGPEASQAADLWWFLLVTAGLVSLLVFALLGAGLGRRRRQDEGSGAAPDLSDVGDRLGSVDRRFVVFGGVVLPAVILLVVGGITVEAVSDLARDEERGGELAVEVTGLQFWWRVHYPDHGFETANEIHIPAGRRVELTLKAEDVIHSFWVPELAGKRDMVPGRVSTLVLEADEPGVYRGQCAEFCGVQHANMAFFVMAHEPAEFDAWLEHEGAPATPPETELETRGREVFESEACAGCHAVRGTRAGGTLGPDLTHVASRRTLGAGTIPNTPGHLAGWISDAQSIKPGSLMPPITLEPDELRAVLAYLEALE